MHQRHHVCKDRSTVSYCEARANVKDTGDRPQTVTEIGTQSPRLIQLTSGADPGFRRGGGSYIQKGVFRTGISGADPNCCRALDKSTGKQKLQTAVGGGGPITQQKPLYPRMNLSFITEPDRFSLAQARCHRPMWPSTPELPQRNTLDNVYKEEQLRYEVHSCT